MKLRIAANSIRFRVTPTEMATLAARGKLESSLTFGLSSGQRLTYAIEACSLSSRVEACYSEQAIKIVIPESLVREWASTSQIGIEQIQSIPDGKTLRISIEKDFECLQPRSDESQADRFPNPAKCLRV